MPVAVCLFVFFFYLYGMMKILFSTLILFVLAGSTQAQPKKDTSKLVCTIELPKTVTSETVFSLRYDCKLSSFKLEVYNRWGQSMFKTESTDAHEIGQLFKPLKEGIYNYTIVYAYYRGGVLNEKKSTGQVQVIR